jgi:hypothetical protein
VASRRALSGKPMAARPFLKRFFVFLDGQIAPHHHTSLQRIIGHTNSTATITTATIFQ